MEDLPPPMISALLPRRVSSLATRSIESEWHCGIGRLHFGRAEEGNVAAVVNGNGVWMDVTDHVSPMVSPT